MKKLFAFILTAVMLLGMFTCVASAEKPTQIRIMGYNSEASRQTYLELMKEKFPECEIIYEFVSSDNFSNVLNTQLQAGNGPDLIELQGDVRPLAIAGYVYDMTNDEYASRYVKSGMGTFTVDDHIYAIPLQSWFEGIFYNKALFRENNIEIPTTWDEYISVWKQFNELGIKGQAVSAGFWETTGKMSAGFMETHFYCDEANKEFDEKFGKGEATLTETWLPYITEWCKLFDEGLITQDMLGISYDQALEEFATGKAAMWQCGPWAVGTLMEKNPDLELGMFPIPGDKPEDAYLLGGPGSAWAVSADSKNIETVKKILDWTSTIEAQNALIKDNVGGSYLEGVKTDMGDIYEACVDTFARGHVYSCWLEKWFNGTPILEALGKGLQEVLAGTKTPEQALMDADEINQVQLKAMIG